MRGLNGNRIALVCFVAACAFFGFLYGVAAEHFRLFPRDTLVRAIGELRQRRQLPHHLMPIRYEATGVKIHDRDAMAPGVTLLTSYWRELGWAPGIRLIDTEGNVLHQWRTDAAEIWPTSPYKDHRAGWFNKSANYVHGTYLFENGDVVFNVEYMGLVRMNAAGEVVWTLPYRTHHSVFRDEGGDFWVCGMKWVEDDEEGRRRAAEYPGLQVPFVEDYVVQVSADGEILKEISVLKALYASGNQHLLWKIGKQRTMDVTHLNDVDVLGTEMADQYPMLDAGDVVFSLRTTHSVCVLDPDTEQVKWLTTGPFLEQHDADFIGNGWISVFDNNADGSRRGSHLGGSRIVAVKPGNGETRVLYAPSGVGGFYTEFGGKSQLLENGNLLITEAGAGRVFEVNVDGRLLWEWIQEHYDEEHVPEVLEATRYALTAEQLSAWATESSE